MAQTRKVAKVTVSRVTSTDQLMTIQSNRHMLWHCQTAAEEQCSTSFRCFVLVLLLLLFALLAPFVFSLFADTLGLSGQACTVPGLGPGCCNIVPVSWVHILS